MDVKRIVMDVKRIVMDVKVDVLKKNYMEKN